MACFSGLVAGCLGLLHPHLLCECAGRSVFKPKSQLSRKRFFSPWPCVQVGGLRLCRVDGRPFWPPPHADGRHRRGLPFSSWPPPLLHRLKFLFCYAGVVWNRDGRRMRGVGAALAFETLPAEGRSWFLGLLQEGYVVGYLMAALMCWNHVPDRRLARNVCDRSSSRVAHGGLHFTPRSMNRRRGCRGALSRRAESGLGKDIFSHLGSFLFLVALMFAFNKLHHSTQDLYPTFLPEEPSVLFANRGADSQYLEYPAPCSAGCFLRHLIESRSSAAPRPW